MVRELHEMQGKSISEIARELGMSHVTVRKYQKQGHISDKRIGSKRGSKLDPYKPYIRELMGLDTASEYLDACLNHATKQKSTYVTFLEELLEAEQLARKQRSYCKKEKH